MFTKPIHGWTNLEIGIFSDRASYLTDVPIDCLDNFIIALKNRISVAINFDAEGWDYYLVATWDDSYVIVNGDDPDLYRVDKDIKELAKELINDIEEYFDEWLNWECCSEFEDETYFNNRRKLLNEKVLMLKSLIK